MKKYFVISDVHSYATPMKKALHDVNFKRTDKEHILIVCGDLFDRGDETMEVYHYIKSLPKNRRILIRGNHELLFLELLLKDFPQSHDFSNGTVKTFCHIAGIDYEKLFKNYWKANGIPYDEIPNKILETWLDIKSKVATSEVTQWLESNEWQNYYEMGNFIFVHSFIPVRLKAGHGYFKYWTAYGIKESNLVFNPNWREAPDFEWEDATWGCPWKLYKAGLFSEEAKNNKILVCGHWHVSDFHKELEGIKEDDYSIFAHKNLIALDACTAASGVVNVLVIENQQCSNRFGKLNLKEDIYEKSWKL